LTSIIQDSSNDFTRLERTSPSTKKDEAASELEQKLQSEKDSRKEERFFWIFDLTILLDIIAFKFLDNIALAVIILLLELIFLIGLAGWMGVDRVTLLLIRFFHAYLPKTRDETKPTE
jgi:hypothetical protein